MARISAAQVDSYSSSDSSWFRLKNNHDTARVQFMYHSMNDLDIYSVHKVNIDGTERFVDCKRTYDDPIDNCPLCAAGMKPTPLIVIALYNVNDKQVQTWTRGRQFLKKLESLINRYGDLTNMVFEIERIGEAGSTDTTYEVFPLVDAPATDISGMEKPNMLGRLILDKSADEMQIFLDTGKFPDTQNNDAQVSRRDSSEEPRRNGSRRSF